MSGLRCVVLERLYYKYCSGRELLCPLLLGFSGPHGGHTMLRHSTDFNRVFKGTAMMTSIYNSTIYTSNVDCEFPLPCLGTPPIRALFLRLSISHH